MAKPELLTYINAQLLRGMSEEDITYKLTSHGWPLIEIQEGFNIILPAAGYAPEPIPAAPQMAYQPAPLQSLPQLSQSYFITTFFNPSLLQGLGAILVVCLVEGLFILLSGNLMIPGTYVLVSTAVFFLFSCLGAGILNLVTRLLSVPNRSFPKALVFTAVNLVLSVVVNALVIGAGAPISLVFIVGIIFSIAFFYYYYNASILKSLTVFFVTLIFSILIYAILFIAGVGVGLSLFQLAPSLHSF
jgi:hypothetical protein